MFNDLTTFIFLNSPLKANWEPLPPGHTFLLGESVYFVARAGVLLAGEKLHVESCHATSSEDPTNSLEVDIINNSGFVTGTHFYRLTYQFLTDLQAYLHILLM